MNDYAALNSVIRCLCRLDRMLPPFFLPIMLFDLIFGYYDRSYHITFLYKVIALYP